MSSSLPVVTCLGSAATTARGRRNAIGNLNAYLKTLNFGKATELSKSDGENLFCSTLKQYEEIATFLARQCIPTVTDGAKAQLAISTAENYFGSIVSWVRETFAKHECWCNPVYLTQSLSTSCICSLYTSIHSLKLIICQ